MSRVIKFRYRVKSYKSPEVITFTAELYEVEIRKFTPDPFGSLDYSIISRDQFTGLYDKHKNEIYEGDIVENASHRQLIEWEGTGWNPFIDNMLDAYDSEYLEIIGNIHETPELMEE